MVENVTSFDPVLRYRLLGSFNRLMNTFDAAAGNVTPEALDDLRADSDRAMRALARVRIEVDRLAEEQDL